MNATDWSVNRLAALATVTLTQHLPVAERRELLGMCGLLDATGRAIAPDDREYHDVGNRFIGFDDEYSRGKLAAKFGEAPPLRDNPYLPEGLRNLKPGSLVKAIERTRTSKCGTVAGHSAHKRRGEQPCVLCLEARRAYNRERKVRKGRQLAPCGTPSAAARHKRNGEPVDEACRLAANAQRAEFKRRARERARTDGGVAA